MVGSYRSEHSASQQLTRTELQLLNRVEYFKVAIAGCKSIDELANIQLELELDDRIRPNTTEMYQLSVLLAETRVKFQPEIDAVTVLIRGKIKAATGIKALTDIYYIDLLEQKKYIPLDSIEYKSLISELFARRSEFILEIEKLKNGYLDNIQICDRLSQLLSVWEEIQGQVVALPQDSTEYSELENAKGKREAYLEDHD